MNKAVHNLVPAPETRRDQTFQHKLEQFNPGMVWLDATNRIVALNDVAMQILGPAAQESLGVSGENLLGLDVLQMHSEKSREKLRFLLRSGSEASCPVKSPPPIAMMINIPDRMLLIKVSKMVGTAGPCGTCMVFYDLTDATTAPFEHLEAHTRMPRRLLKIPVYRSNRVVLIDLKDVVRFQGEGHYTTIVTKDDQYLSNFSLTDLESRLDPGIYFRVHRSHIVNLQCAVELVRGEESVSLMLADAARSVVPVSRSRTAQLKELLGIV